jgi:alanine dehydrogenase
MRIGIPRESFLEEKRIALAPAGVDALIRAGHTVYVEQGAGEGSKFPDDEFLKVGAKIVYTKDEVYQRSEMIVKVTPITDEEAELMQEGQTLFSFQSLAVGKRKNFETMINKKITSFGFEIIEDDHGLPILQSMSEIAGQLAVQVGERYLEAGQHFGRGVLLGGIPGVAPAAVVILGAGVVGRVAAKAALSRGAQVIILDRDLQRLKYIDTHFDRKLTTVVANPYTISRGVKFADVLIGAVLIKGEKVPHIVSEEMVKTMKEGSVIVDVSIDQGGCVETSRPTTLSDPVFIQHNVFHYCVPNIPALVPRTASYGLNNAAIKYIMNVADNGLTNALLGDDGLSKGVCTYQGYCSNEAISRTFNFEYRRLHIFSRN